MLALNGEVGELQEIFQWKSNFDTTDVEKLKELFTEKELIHIGEEISDVFIYTTRLADMCSIDLAKCVRLFLSLKDPIDSSKFDYMKSTTCEQWNSLSFLELQQLIDIHFLSKDSVDVSKTQSISVAQNFLSTKKSLLSIKNSPRRACLAVQNSAARASSLFCLHQETESIIGLPAWEKQSVAELAISLASIIVLLTIISKSFGYSINQCITEKFAKNAKKYPVDRVKGSSAKYTHYQTNQNIMSKFIDNKITLIAIGVVVGFAVSRLKSFI